MMKASSSFFHRAFIVTWICYASFYLTRKPFSVVKSQLKTELGLSTAELGVIDTSFLAAYAFAQLVLGPLGDRFGARPMLGAMLAISALSTAAVARCSAPWTIVVWMSINGASQSAAFPLCMKALMPHLAEASRGTTLGWWTTCQTVGGIVATALAAATLGRYGWRVAFLLPGAIVLLSAAFVAGCLPHEKRVAAAAAAAAVVDGGGGGSGRSAIEEPVGAATATISLEDGASSSSSSSNSSGASLASVLRGTPLLLNIGCAYCAIKLVRYTLIMWLPFFITSQLEGYSDESAGYMSTIFDGGATLGTIVGGTLSDSLCGGRHLAVTLPAIAIGAMIVLNFGSLASLHGSIGLSAGMAFLGFLISIPDSLLGSAAAVAAVQRSGQTTSVLTTALSLVNGIASAGPILQGSLTPIIAARFGWDGVWTACAVLCALAALLLLPAAADERRVGGESNAKKRGRHKV